MSFSAKPYHERRSKLGNTSEKVFEDVMDKWVRYGFNDPPINLSKLPLKVRYTPDYIQEGGVLVEVVAMGNDSRLKLKVEKMQALLLWQREMPVHLFVWDGGRKRNQWGVSNLHDLFVVCAIDGKGERFHSDNKPYWSIPRLSIPTIGGWHKYEGELQ